MILFNWMPDNNWRFFFFFWTFFWTLSPCCHRATRLRPPTSPPPPNQTISCPYHLLILGFFFFFSTSHYIFTFSIFNIVYREICFATPSLPIENLSLKPYLSSQYPRTVRLSWFDSSPGRLVFLPAHLAELDPVTFWAKSPPFFFQILYFSLTLTWIFFG